RFIAGFIVATVLWLWISPLLARGVAAATEPLLHLDARFHDAQLSASESMVSVDAPHGTFPQTKYPADQLTFNLILLVALFASNRRPFRDRNIVAFLISLAIILALQPPALLVTIETYYANFTKWGEPQYGNVAANVWLVLSMFWRLVGMFGAVFACWWVSPRD
ncbi:MAG TPA: hypothetical protein VGJ82_07500, partial [Thermoanaerobaculia bacterium]